MHLAEAFIQSDLQCIQAIHFFCQYVTYIMFTKTFILDAINRCPALIFIFIKYIDICSWA